MKRFLLSIVILPTFPSFLLANETTPNQWPWGMQHMMFWMPWGGMLIMPIFLIVFVAILFLIFYRRAPSHTEPPMFKTESAMEILKKRYAKGEITKEEFESMKKDLS